MVAIPRVAVRPSWRDHLCYLRLVLDHKRRVYRAGRRLGVSRWRLLIHDWNKLLPDEWSATVAHYAAHRYAYAPGDDPAYDVAWNHHRKRCRHHWHYWVLIGDDGALHPLPMPDADLREMVADWTAVGQAPGRGTVADYYARCGAAMLLHPETRRRLEVLLATI